MAFGAEVFGPGSKIPAFRGESIKAAKCLRCNNLQAARRQMFAGLPIWHARGTRGSHAWVVDRYLFDKRLKGSKNFLEKKFPVDYLRSMLTPIQHLAVKYLAAGWSTAKVAAELRLKPYAINKWKEDPEVVEAIEKGVLHHVELVEAMLLEGESRAAETLIAALAASRNGQPQWQVRVDAAKTLLDRAGQRGKAIDRQVQAQAPLMPGSGGVMSGEKLEEGLRKALRDPGVRAWLKSTGGNEVLAEAADGEPILEIPPPPPQLSSGEEVA